MATLTGAQIHHGKAIDFEYGNYVSDGDVLQLGNMRLTILETPGHTYESISLILSDTNVSDDPVAVFTGDSLFIGDVGRTDFFPDSAEEVAGLMYDSIFKKIVPLGDQVILYPAHGAGSVCGSGMADREFSTIGYEKKHNPVLQKTDREDFIRYKVNEHHDKPPYFRQMEIYNQSGEVPLLGTLPTPRPMSAEKFSRKRDDGMTVIDTRSPEAISGALIPGSLAIPVDMLPAFAGWFLSYEKPIGLIVADYDDIDLAVRHLLRLGFDRVAGFLQGGLHSWETAGFSFDTIPSVHVSELVERINKNQNFTLLDVRSQKEFARGHLPGAENIYVGELPEKLDHISRDRPVTTFCGSGKRAVIAASILKDAGFEIVDNCLGSMEACQAYGCPIDHENGA